MRGGARGAPISGGGVVTKKSEGREGGYGCGVVFPPFHFFIFCFVLAFLCLFEHSKQPSAQTAAVHVLCCMDIVRCIRARVRVLSRCRYVRRATRDVDLDLYGYDGCTCGECRTVKCGWLV